MNKAERVKLLLDNTMRLLRGISGWLFGWLLIGSLVDLPLLLLFDKTWNIGAWIGIITGIYYAKKWYGKR